MDPATIQIFGIPGYVIFWILTLLAFGLFGSRIFTLVKHLRQAQPENRFDNLGKRLQLIFTNVLGQKRLLYEYVIGAAHFVIFWGFMLFALTFAWNLPRWLFPFLPMPYADEIGFIRLLFVVFSVLVLIGIVVAAIRRVFFPPPHLQKTRDAAIILVLISLVVLTTIFGMGFRAAAVDPAQANWHPIDSFMKSIFAGVNPVTAEKLYILMFWLHQLVVLGFLAYLPYSKHLHLLASPFNVFFSHTRPAGDLSFAGAGEKFFSGASQWNEFTWKQLLNGFACAECGRCDRVCPALNSGYALSPRMIIHDIKEHFLEAGIRGNGKKQSENNGPRPLIGGIVSEAELWACTTCYACAERCPVLNEHLALIVNMRRHLVSQGAVDQTLQKVLTQLRRYGNSFGQSERMRAKWTQGLPFKIKDARKEPVDYLWFVGDYASYDVRLQEITKATAQIFQNAGMNFGILFDGERNSGNDVRRIGEEGLFDILKTRNLQALEKVQHQEIITTDPHTYNTLKNEYGLDGTTGNGRVRHYTEVLDELMQKGKLRFNRKLDYTVTYQDPCYLGRYNGIYEAPRRILRALGVKIVEMPRNRAQSYCCGAGGGRIWMEDAPGIKERPAENRIREAVSLPDVRVLVTACPKDIVMFQDAAKTTGNEVRIAVKDLSELVWEAIRPEFMSLS